MHKSGEFISAIAAGFAVAWSALGADSYQVQALEGTYVYAQAINEKNQVVGFVNPQDSWRASYGFLWDAVGGLISLGGYSAADINDHGQVAGKSGRLQAAVWEHGQWVLLEGRQEADGINNRGQVTGLISAQPSIPGPYAPYRDDDIHSPGFYTLQTPFARASQGFAINNRGQIVAECGTEAPDTIYVGLFYDSDLSYTILDTGGNYECHALAINDLGQIAGYAQRERSDNLRAVFWGSAAAEIGYMGALGEGFGLARAINNFGQTVGSSAGRAFLWSARKGMRDLNELIAPGSDIVLTSANDINDQGAIAVCGIDSLGQKRSFLLLPPPPQPLCVDIRPRVVPNPLNIHGKEHLPVAVLGSSELDVDAIDLSSVRVAGVPPVGYLRHDIGGPGPRSKSGSITRAAPDGYMDLVLQFSSEELVEKLLLDGEQLSPGRVLILHLSALLSDETRVEGADSVTIHGRVSLRGKGQGPGVGRGQRP